MNANATLVVGRKYFLWNNDGTFGESVRNVNVSSSSLKVLLCTLGVYVSKDNRPMTYCACSSRKIGGSKSGLSSDALPVMMLMVLQMLP